MERARASMRRALVSASLTAACLGGADAPALAMDDTSTLTSVLGIFGYSEGNDEKIVYRDRARLVLPPNRQALPEPSSRNSAHPASWPSDQDVSAPAPAPAQQTGQKQGGDGDERGPTTCMVQSADGACLIVTDADEPGTSSLRRSLAPARASSESRRHLTEPPAAYREQVAGGKGLQDKDKDAAWYDPSALFGRVFGGD